MYSRNRIFRSCLTANAAMRHETPPRDQELTRAENAMLESYSGSRREFRNEMKMINQAYTLKAQGFKMLPGESIEDYVARGGAR